MSFHSFIELSHFISAGISIVALLIGNALTGRGFWRNSVSYQDTVLLKHSIFAAIIALIAMQATGIYLIIESGFSIAGPSPYVWIASKSALLLLLVANAVALKTRVLPLFYERCDRSYILKPNRESDFDELTQSHWQFPLP